MTDSGPVPGMIGNDPSKTIIPGRRIHSAPGMGLDPPYLADRSAQLDRFDKYLTGFPTFPRNVRLTGLRGVGKTVLLQHYAAAEARGWVVVRRECSEHLQTESTFALALVEDCRSAVEHSSRNLALRQRSSAAASRARPARRPDRNARRGHAGRWPPTFATGQPAMLEDRLFQALELACEGAAAGPPPRSAVLLRRGTGPQRYATPPPISTRYLPRERSQGTKVGAGGNAGRVRATHIDRQPCPRQELLGAHVPSGAARRPSPT